MELTLTQFSDYRAYLVAYAQLRKQTNPRWSYGAWARKLSLNGASSLTKIVQGKRNPGERITEKLIRYFEFNHSDASYFRDLVRLHKHKRDAKLTVLLLENLQHLHPNSPIRILDDKTFTAIANWYFYAIREMVQLDRFFEDPDWISKKLRFKITPTDVTKAIETLLTLKMLRRNAKGSLEITDLQLDTNDDFASEALKRYHEQMLENAKTSIRTVEPAQREFTSTTFAMSKEDLVDAKSAIRQFRKRFVSLFEKQKGDTIYQIQLQLFPLTREEAETPRRKK